MTEIRIATSDLGISTTLASGFIEAIHDQKPVSGLTHAFYRYPARFSPLFARTAIRMFTQPGDVVFDPFMGGGTALVEARVLGRRSIGADISELATFVSQVKTTPLSRGDFSTIRTWSDSLRSKLNRDYSGPEIVAKQGPFKL